MIRVLITTYVILTIKIHDLTIIHVIDYLKEYNLYDICVERCCRAFDINTKKSIDTIAHINIVIMENPNNINEFLATMKEHIISSKSKEEFYNTAQKCIMTTDIERKKNAEVLTPVSLVKEMLSKIPTWKNTKIIISTNFSSFRIDWNIFKSFKRTFWQDFI